MLKVAIVEDDRFLRETLTRLIADAPGMDCTAAFDTAEDALKRLPSDWPDVVLMDINLPGRSGIECAARLKAAHPALQILMLTVYEDTERIFKALKAGASGYLLKRSDPQAILDAIVEVRNGGAPMTGHIARMVVQSFRTTGSEPVTAALSERETEILELASRGFATKEIAARLSISVPTVNTHLQHIYQKLHVRSRTEAVIKYLNE
jgi:DNA-binding NarL/FixJ family response regulator